MSEEINPSSCAKNDAVLRKVKEEKNVIHTIKRSKCCWVGDNLRRNWSREHVSERKNAEEDVISYWMELR